MSKKEATKENISSARNAVFTFLAAIFGIFGYGIINIETISKAQMLGGIFALIFVSFGFVFSCVYYYKKIKTLERMR